MGGGYWVFEDFCFLDAFRGFKDFKDFKGFMLPKSQPAYLAKAWHTLSWKLRPTVDVETPLFMMANASMLPFEARG